MSKTLIQRFNTTNTETIKSKYSVGKLFTLNKGLSASLTVMVQFAILFLVAYFIITGCIMARTLLE